ncbi:glycosyltransferase [Agrobacterium larrymoorei]|uniref:Glycosyltransferase involved in cell wall biosynthesis n=1 Tax=Agrobacterium larrymoorei TaxID=160699 RepID=A0ABU0UF01_9HYPH|nr:glycosyltransferase [Agrobacterium larrymoorei]MDQ1183514.1 glycosyltransferase involved in cell wall biosynthesis [Agrobacterium larrymoorei]
MRICIVAQTFAPQEEGGAEIVARMCAKELARHHEVFVLSLGMAGDRLAPTGETMGEDGIRVVRVNWDNSYLPGHKKPLVGRFEKARWHLKASMGAVSAHEIKAIFARERVDLVYAHNSARMQPALFEASRQLNIPFCIHMHDYALICPKSSMFSAGGNCDTACLKCRVLTSRLKSDGEGMTAIAVSEALKQTYLRAGVLTKAEWHVLRNENLREDKLHKPFVGRDSARSEIFTFGYLGALSEEKGIEDLIRAFVDMPNRQSAKLIIAGRGREDYVRYLQSIADGAPITFMGFTPPENVYGVADAVVLPSRWREPQSLILIEAAVYGVPLIATNLGGTPEIVQYMRTGWCYDPSVAGALTEAMEKALRIGHGHWWAERDHLFPGIRNFKGTAEASRYYERLNGLLIEAQRQDRLHLQAL